jgi:hypothetical protein
MRFLTGIYLSSLLAAAVGMLQEIDSLEKQYVMEKMGELTLRSCSIQSRKPVRSIGHNHDLQVTSEFSLFSS